MVGEFWVRVNVVLDIYGLVMVVKEIDGSGFIVMDIGVDDVEVYLFEVCVIVYVLEEVIVMEFVVELLDYVLLDVVEEVSVMFLFW